MRPPIRPISRTAAAAAMRSPIPDAAWPPPRGSFVEGGVADDEDEEQADDDEVAPVPAADDPVQHDRSEDDEEREIDRGHRKGGEMVRDRDGDPPEKPQGDQPEQGPPCNRGGSGPARQCGEEEARHHRDEVPEQHFVGVPGDRVEGGREHECCVKGQDPEGHAERRPDRREEKEGPEPRSEESVPGPGRVRSDRSRHLDSLRALQIQRSVMLAVRVRWTEGSRLLPAGRAGARMNAGGFEPVSSVRGGAASPGLEPVGRNDPQTQSAAEGARLRRGFRSGLAAVRRTRCPTPPWRSRPRCPRAAPCPSPPRDGPRWRRTSA